jgi:hypothetical protein
MTDTTAARFPKSTDPAPDGTYWDEYDNPAEWVDKLPPTRHVPAWEGLSSHPTFLCAPCSMREEGVVYAWPCDVAVKHGVDIARAYGWEAAT